MVTRQSNSAPHNTLYRSPEPHKMACTKQLNRFKQRQANLLNFVSLYQSLYINLPHIRDLRPELEDPEDRKLWNELLKAANTYDEQVEMGIFPIMTREMYVTRNIDIFNDYIASLLTLIYSVQTLSELVESLRSDLMKCSMLTA